MNEGIFEVEYGKLNKEQKEAVDSIEGPVMVVAGPGTGKTQILSLRIGNILKQTDTKADSVLCLTFTNAGVKAMRERLRKYIGNEANKIKLSTFHSFAIDFIGKNFEVLGLDKEPQMMDEKDAVSLCDDILHGNEWEYLRPRSDASRYFRDLKSLISLLKRERIKPQDFGRLIKEDIESIKNNPENISSRGATKGELKKEYQNKIESLNRTLESVKFYELYEEKKLEKNLFDYDDVLEALVRVVEESEDAKAKIQEEYAYILIDEHQDSSGIQNEFLEKVWGSVEEPNIFVVGDDRQLIYGFGGASLEYFENFKHTFGKAKLITLTENYRSTQQILDSAHVLLKSSLVKEKLKSNRKESHPLKLVEADYPRDEILAAGLLMLEKNKEGVDFNDMAVLVPKNRQVKSTVTILRDLSIPVAERDTINLFEIPEAIFLMKILEVIANPDDGVAFSSSFFDQFSNIPPIKAHEFIRKNNMRSFSLLDAKEERGDLFSSENEVNVWIKKLKILLSIVSESNLYSLVQRVGTELLLDNAKEHRELVLRVSVLRTVLHLVLLFEEKNTTEIQNKNTNANLKSFLEFVKRLESYGEDIPLALFGKGEGVQVLTLHGSKGLEFDFVWIAHMDQSSFAGGGRSGFSLPSSVEDLIEKKDEEVLKRELYVAMTRAKRFCSVSYALHSYKGKDQELAHVLAEIQNEFEKQENTTTESMLLKHDPRIYTDKKEVPDSGFVDLEKLKELVAKEYEDKKVSVSLLNNFFECPWKWYFRNLLQLPEPKSESLEFGNIVHNSIDQILKTPKKPNIDEVKEIVDRNVLKSNFGDEKKQKEIAKLALKVVHHWVSERLGEIEKKRENEQNISLIDPNYPHLNIYGKIDLVEHVGEGMLRVTDFKTGNPKKKSEVEKPDEEGRMSNLMRQLAMYSYLLNKNKKWNAHVTESVLEFLEEEKEKDRFYRTTIEDEQIDLLIKDIKEYDELLKNGSWTDRPCHYNPYGRRNEECEYCKMAEIYK